MSRSEDGGATWLPPQVMDSGGGNVRLAAAGDRVVLYSIAATHSGR